MADKKTSWRKRRWKLFIKLYQDNADFRTALQKSSKYPNIYRILARYDIPYECAPAIRLYLNDSNLKENEYLNLILSPLLYLNLAQDTVGPKRIDGFMYDSGERSAQSFVVNQLGEDTPTQELSISLAKRLFGGYTALLMSPYVKKQELHEFIDEYWNEIEQLVNKPFAEKDGVGSYSHEQAVAAQEILGKKIYAERTNTNWERDNFIMKLHDEGLTDDQIAGQLSLNEKYKKAGNPKLTANNIKQIRFRLRNRGNVQ